MDSLIKLFAEVLDVAPEELNDDSSPDNVKSWDSLAAMELVAMLEGTFSMELTTQEIMKMRSIGIVRQVLGEKGVTID